MSKLVDRFVPEHLGDDESLARKQAAVAVRTVFILVPFSAGGVVFIHWVLRDPVVTAGMTLLPLLMAIAPLVLRKFGSLAVASGFILGPMYGAVTLYALSTGGLFAPSVSILVVIPPLAVVYLGMKAGIVWLAIVVATWGAMFVAESMGFDGAAYFDPDRYPARRLVELFLVGGLVAGLFYLKTSLQQWLVAVVRKKEAETRAVVETAPDGILTVRLDGAVVRANQAVSRIFECDHDEIVGRDIRNLVSTLTEDRLENRGDAGATEEHRGRRDGEEFPLEIAFGLLEDAEADEESVVMLLRDITDRKRRERQLREARDQALEASRAKTRFLANMTHELRTPLNAVIGYSEMLLEEIDFLDDADEDPAEFVDRIGPDLRRILDAGEHQLELIDDILNLSKIEADEVRIEIETFDVRRFCQQLADRVESLAADNDNDFETDFASELGVMESDPDKVRKILFNLLSNASKFTENGLVRLSVDRDDEAGEVVFVVEDTGIGMSDEQLQEVFEAFSQADTSPTREFEGAGLGLTIASHFGGLLDGDIDVESTQGEGTTFTLRLPVRLDEPDEQ